MRPLTKATLGTLAAAVLVGGLLREASLARSWRRHQEELAARVARAEARVCERPALRGETLPCEAWEAYERAIAAAEALSVEDAALLAFLDGKPGRATREEMAAALAGVEAVLEPLRLGARSRSAARPYEWRRGASAPQPRLLGSRRVAMLAAAHGELLGADGRGREAAELLLDVLQYGRDHARNATLIAEMIGHAVETIALERLARLLEADALAPEDAALVADALARLDEGPAHREGVRNDALGVTVTLSEELPLGPLTGNADWAARLATWRTGFSFRAQVLGYVEAAERWAAVMDRARELPWDEARRELEAFQREVERDPNLVVRIALSTHGSVERSWRRVDALSRLVRAGAEERAGRAPSAIADPFGDELRRERRDGALLLWSLGDDGEDDGGAGAFTKGEDLVLRLAEG